MECVCHVATLLFANNVLWRRRRITIFRYSRWHPRRTGSCLNVCESSRCCHARPHHCPASRATMVPACLWAHCYSLHGRGLCALGRFFRIFLHTCRKHNKNLREWLILSKHRITGNWTTARAWNSSEKRWPFDQAFLCFLPLCMFLYLAEWHTKPSPETLYSLP
jgi:hypothetical protein